MLNNILIDYKYNLNNNEQKLKDELFNEILSVTDSIVTFYGCKKNYYSESLQFVFLIDNIRNYEKNISIKLKDFQNIFFVSFSIINNYVMIGINI